MMRSILDSGSQAKIRQKGRYPSITVGRGRGGALLAAVWCLLWLSLLAGCQVGETAEAPPQGPVATPTVHSAFSSVSHPTPRPTSTPVAVSILTTETPISASVTPTPTVVTKEVSVYHESLNSDWSLENSSGVDLKVDSQTNPYQGHHGLEVRPERGYAQLFFTVRPDAASSYPQNRVLAVRFWLSGGSNSIAPSDLAVTVVGSNRQPHWEADDNSVDSLLPQGPVFSETRLYFLGLNGSIPPYTWVEVELWLDDRQYDPIYRYVTGFYIKNDEEFLKTYFVDEVRLLMIDEGSSS